MYVEVCAYCGKVRQIGRGVRLGGKTYCCQAHASADNRLVLQAARAPADRITHRGGSGYWLTEDDGVWLLEDGGKWVMEDYN